MAAAVEEDVLGAVGLVKSSYSYTFLSFLVLAVSAFPTEYGWLHRKYNDEEVEPGQSSYSYYIFF